MYIIIIISAANLISLKKLILYIHVYLHIQARSVMYCEISFITSQYFGLAKKSLIKMTTI